MNAAEDLERARAAGVRVDVDGHDLVLEASAPPPPAVLKELAHHKVAIVALLRSKRDGFIARHRPFPSQTGAAPTRQLPAIGRKTHRKGSNLDAVSDLLKAAKAARVSF